jgi:hypothetical protein
VGLDINALALGLIVIIHAEIHVVDLGLFILVINVQNWNVCSLVAHVITPVMARAHFLLAPMDIQPLTLIICVVAILNQLAVHTKMIVEILVPHVVHATK